MNLQVFNYTKENVTAPITSLNLDGDIWFIAKEICDILEIQNSKQAVAALDEDQRLRYTLYTTGQGRKTNIINESGLYDLVFRSNKEAAKKFRKWVTKEVLPALRKTGTYTINQASPKPSKPQFLTLYYDNMHTMPLGGFTVGYMVFHLLYVRLIAHQHRIADAAPDGTRIRPDRSISPRFQRYLDTHYKSVAHLHKPIRFRDLDGMYQEQTVKLYDNLLLTIFVNYFENVWLKEVAIDYFRGKDDAAILAIEKLIAVPAPKQIGYTSALKQSA